MTERYELRDATVREWEAIVLESSLDTVVLDRSAFFPGGGGQPPDHGVLLWGGVRTRVVGARPGEEVILVVHEEDPVPPVGTAVLGALDDERRTALMRTHSALHVLSAVVFRDFGARVTGSAMVPLSGRMDFNLPDAPADFRSSVEAACNAAIRADHRIAVRFVPAPEAAAMTELSRSEESRIPEGLEVVRLVDIVGLDTQADAGTHVASTAQIGAVRVTKMESKGKGFRRLRLGVQD
jgi:misacylated tRNA(Ala) deacylase